MEMLNVVDEKGKIVGEEYRKNIHKKGLLHREINVWFYTPRKELIFQKRSETKDTYPNLLDATVGGHVGINMSYEDAALKEIREETGLELKLKDLTFIKEIHTHTFDPVTGNQNNALRAVYSFCFKGNINDLKLEEGNAVGFVAWPLAKLFKATDSDKKQFTPSMFQKETLDIFNKILADYTK